MRFARKFWNRLAFGVLATLAFFACTRGDVRSTPTVSATWSPNFPSGKVSLTITNQSGEPIRSSPNLHLGIRRVGEPIPSEQPYFRDKTLIDPYVEFIVPRDDFIQEDVDHIMAGPVIIAPNETKTFKLEVPAQLSD